MILISLLLTCDERWQHTFHTVLARQQLFVHYNSSRCKVVHVLGSSITNRTSKKMGVAFNFLNLYKEDGNNLLQRIITDDESWIHFYESDRKSASIVWKKREKSAEKIQEWVVHCAGVVNSFLGFLWLAVCWIWFWYLQREVKWRHPRYLFLHFNAF